VWRARRRQSAARARRLAHTRQSPAQAAIPGHIHTGTSDVGDDDGRRLRRVQNLTVTGNAHTGNGPVRPNAALVCVEYRTARCCFSNAR